MRKVVIGHRGVPSLAPENTLSSFKLAAEKNVPWVECDVDVLGDGTVVISHDATLDRCTDRCGNLAEIGKKDLRNIDAGSWFGDDFIGEQIPELSDFITFINETNLSVNLEIKSCMSDQLSQMLLDGVIHILNNHWEKERPLIVSSFNHLVLADFKKRMPQVDVACLFESHTLYDDWPSIIKRVGAEYIHPEDKGLTQALISQMKEENLNINVWTVNDLARANQLFNWGVDGICTDISQSFPSRYRHG